ncbi:MAG: tetratricopeptide repeat protein [Bryobacterales bacterium]|nr:tetratricopeptide repeat protein [Bryobacterales bacterium]
MKANRFARQTPRMAIPALIFAFLLPAFAAGPAQSIAALEREAGEQYRRGSYQEAERLQRKVLQLYQDAAATPPGDLEKACYRLAGIYLAQGKLTLAGRYAKMASGHQSRSGASSADRARVLNMFAQIRFQQRRYREAAETQEKAVQLMERDDRSTGLARMLNDLAMIRAATGELRLARPLLERAVELHRQSAGQPDGAGEALGNLALVCARQGDYREAEANYRQAVELMERTRGPYHPHLGMLLSEYAAVLGKNGRNAEARAIDRRAKAILQSVRLPGRDIIDASALH